MGYENFSIDRNDTKVILSIEDEGWDISKDYIFCSILLTKRFDFFNRNLLLNRIEFNLPYKRKTKRYCNGKKFEAFVTKFLTENELITDVYNLSTCKTVNEYIDNVISVIESINLVNEREMRTESIQFIKECIDTNKDIRLVLMTTNSHFNSILFLYNYELTLKSE